MVARAGQCEATFGNATCPERLLDRRSGDRDRESVLADGRRRLCQRHRTELRARTSARGASPAGFRALSAVAQHVSQAQLDERLARDSDAPRFTVDLAQEIDGEVHVDALNLPSWPSGILELRVCRQVYSTVVQAVQFLGGQGLNSPGTGLLLPLSRGDRDDANRFMAT
jgi:hypothetical protein